MGIAKAALGACWLVQMAAAVMCAAFLFWTILWVAAWVAGADPNAGQFTFTAAAFVLVAFAALLGLHFVRDALRSYTRRLVASVTYERLRDREAGQSRRTAPTETRRCEGQQSYVG